MTDGGDDDDDWLAQVRLPPPRRNRPVLAPAYTGPTEVLSERLILPDTQAGRRKATGLMTKDAVRRAKKARAAPVDYTNDNADGTDTDRPTIAINTPAVLQAVPLDVAHDNVIRQRHALLGISTDDEDPDEDDDGEEEESDVSSTSSAGDQTISQLARALSSGGNNPHEHFLRPVGTASHRAECFLCGWGNSLHDMVHAPLVNTLMGILYQNYGGASNAEIARMMEVYYKKRIYDPTRNMPYLSMKIALEHIEGIHVLSPLLYVGEKIRALKKVESVLANNIVLSDGSVNTNVVKALNETIKTTMLLYNAKIPKMNFYSDDVKFNIRTMGSLIQIVPQFKKPPPPKYLPPTRKRPRSPVAAVQSDEESLFGESAPSPPKKRPRIEPVDLFG